MFNNDPSSGRVRCHGKGDLVMGPNRDWARVSGNRAIMQKLVLFFFIPKGEVINEPDVGCSLQGRLFDKLTENTLIETGMELEYDLKQQIPELGVQLVQVARGGNDGEVSITIYAAAGKWTLLANREELLDVNLIEEFGVGS